MKKSAIRIPHGYFHRYIDRAEDLPLMEVLENSLSALENLELEQLKAWADTSYAPGKWTIKDIFQHLTDCERIFQYRALRIARNDQMPLPGFDQDPYAAVAGAGRRSLDDLLKELKTVRTSSIHLFGSFDEEALLRKGLVSENELSVLSIGFLLAGHQAHHLDIIRLRYLTLS